MLFSGKENIFKYLVAFQKMFWKIFCGVWLGSWKYHRKHIFYLLLTFSQLPNKYIISFIPQYRNKNKTQKKISSNPVKLREEGREKGDWVWRKARSRGKGEGEIARRGAAIAIDKKVRSRSARRWDRDWHSAATIRPGSKGRGRSRKREIGGAISPLRLGLGRCLCKSFFFSLFLPLHVCELLSLRVSIPKVIWR